MSKAISVQDKARKDWAESISKKDVAFYGRGNSRIRSELLVYAVDKNDMILGYFVDSSNVGVVFDKPMKRDELMHFKVKTATLKELY